MRIVGLSVGNLIHEKLSRFRILGLVASSVAFAVIFLAACGGPSTIVARFVPVGAASRSGLNVDAKIVTERLDALGDPAANASVRGKSLVISGGTSLPVPASTLVEPGHLYFRPVFCFAPPYSPPANGTASSGSLPTCGGHYFLIPTIVNVIPYNVSIDPAFSLYPSTTAAYDDAHPNQNVLVPAAPGSRQGGVRYLLGPTGVSGTAVDSAQAVYNTPTWDVVLTFTKTGSSEWDKLLQQQFHAYVGIDLDGQVLSAPLTLPNQSTFTSFGGKAQISGNFTKTRATDLAVVVRYGPLPVPLREKA
jgi:hypothetical protein